MPIVSDLPVPAQASDVPDEPTAVTPEAVVAVAVDTTDAVADPDTSEAPPVRFDQLGLPERLVRRLQRENVVETFPIQAATIPDALAGRDVLGRARTGSGKTLAFGLPALVRLQGRRAGAGRPLALVLVPTRELAMQVTDAIAPYAKSLGVRFRAVFGGVPMDRQIAALRGGVGLLVATPGRLHDLIRRGQCDLRDVELTILDEADQMADMGFLPEVRELLDQVRSDGQRLLFSATLDGAVDELVRDYLRDPVNHSVDPQGGTTGTMSHHVLVVAPRDKSAVTAQIASRSGRTILFLRSKLAVDRVASELQAAGLPVGGLHGGMRQGARTRTLSDFKSGRLSVLVATDVAARGIHVDGIDLVVHVDPTMDAKDYLHRAGRTARAGQSGTVVTIALPHQRRSVDRMLGMAGVRAETVKVRPGDPALEQLVGAPARAWQRSERPAGEERGGQEQSDRRGGRGFGGARDDRGNRAGRESGTGSERPGGWRPRRTESGERPGEKAGERSDRPGYGNREHGSADRARRGGSGGGWRPKGERGSWESGAPGSRRDPAATGERSGGWERRESGPRKTGSWGRSAAAPGTTDNRGGRGGQGEGAGRSGQQGRPGFAGGGRFRSGGRPSSGGSSGR